MLHTHEYSQPIKTVEGHPVRLSLHEIEVIRSVVRTIDPSARIVLFGSRTDNTKKGGDIDLLIISSSLRGQDKRIIRMNLCSQLGEQKIDIIVSNDISAPFVRIALQGGVDL
ncbi:MAG TPA: nucleotidyltransferase domain-containing protein [Methanospirillum sp.]|nr:nucleotidyltransferase domain-containing protein [Methanospirillum sp.]